jgi:hypothetical protein
MSDENAVAANPLPPLPARDDAAGADTDTAPNDTPEYDAGATIASAHLDSLAQFDPAVHAVDADGRPRIKADGTYARKRGRKAGASSARTPVEAVSAARVDPADVAACQAANLVINGCTMAFGPAWAASPGEAAGMQGAFKDYFAARGVPSMPPEIGLAVVLLAYAAPRIDQEKAKGKIALAWQWLKMRLKK